MKFVENHLPLVIIGVLCAVGYVSVISVVLFS